MLAIQKTFGNGVLALMGTSAGGEADSSPAGGRIRWPGRSTMIRRRLGTQGLEVGAIGLGCMGMSEFYGPADEAESIATIHRALDLGVTLLDTADMYGPHTNEELVGRALARPRASGVVLATKFGIVRGRGRELARGVNGRPEYVRAACEASLKRLGVDTIDLYYQHRVDPKTPIEETVGAMAELVREGKVRFLGLSEASAGDAPPRARRAPDPALQSEYSLLDPRPRGRGARRAAASWGSASWPTAPLGRGFLTGRFSAAEDLSRTTSAAPRRASRAGTSNGTSSSSAGVEAVAREKGVHRPRSSRWPGCWRTGEDIVPIPGTKRREYLEENVAALDVHLTPEDVARLDAHFPEGAARGDRYGAVAATLLDR